MQSLLQVQWLVKPLKTPRPWLHCSRCDARTPFISSDRFRANAQKKRIDAWLVYRCAQCDQSWNFPVLERCPVNAIAPEVLRGLMENDAALAWHHAFDLTRLGRHSVRIECFAELSIERQAGLSCEGDTVRIEIAIAAPYACGIRLDKLLARELGLSRSAIGRLAVTKTLVVTPTTRRTLSQAVQDGQRIVIDLSLLPRSVSTELLAATGGAAGLIRHAASFCV